MVRIGIAGVGFMGMTHYRAINKVRGGKVTAICTRSEKKRAGDWRGIGGNFGDHTILRCALYGDRRCLRFQGDGSSGRY